VLIPAAHRTHSRPTLLLFSLLLAASLAAGGCHDRSAPGSSFAWPSTTRQSRPWTYWWWMGSAVNKEDITRQLEAFSSCGLGGVHIIPIYGADGFEKQYLNYLSPGWMEMLRHTLAEARRLDLGVDMTLGTGWPFGGGWVDTPDAAARVLFRTWSLADGERLNGKVIPESGSQDAPLQTLMAFSQSGDTLDLTGRVDNSGNLDWVAPGGNWRLYAAFLDRPVMQVKRAAPGDEGNVIDYFSRTALERYLARFDSAFADIPRDSTVRAFYHDSYENETADWTPGLFEQFSRLSGYDLHSHLPELLGDSPDRERVERVRFDYRQTVADLILDGFTRPWVAWSHAHGALTRNQAHGSPGNLLDLYAAADIPETEIFGPAEFHIPGLRVEPNLSPDFGRTNPLANQFAASAAHVAGRNLISSETGTWLAEHFQVALSQAKPEIDQLFSVGINHIFFHGMTYSPASQPWPGWLFYASTNFGPSNTLWEAMPALNAYIARCQSFLQAGNPDNDILLYFPLPDRWQSGAGLREDSAGDRRGAPLYFSSVYALPAWLPDTALSCLAAAGKMRARGYGFDYVSDNLLENVDAGRYPIQVLPRCTWMPLNTLERVLALAHDGASVIFLGALPQDVPGLGDLESRRTRFKALLNGIRLEKDATDEIARATLGRGQVLVGDDLQEMLESVKARREPAADYGLALIRRALPGGKIYFLFNPGPRTVGDWVGLSGQEKAVVVFDPLSGKTGRAATRAGQNGSTEVFLQLEPGQSLILRTHDSPVEGGSDWVYSTPDVEGIDLAGPWRLTFLRGGPQVPAGEFSLDSLVSWTEIGGSQTKAFGGTARYGITFDLPEGNATGWRLDLGQVRESARVRVNGQDCGTLWSLPFHLDLDQTALHPGQNTLEIEVTNLAANRIADMDRRGVAWRIFHDINFVDIRYQPFDASGWPLMPSGLLGPVRLVRLKPSAGL